MIDLIWPKPRRVYIDWRDGSDWHWYWWHGYECGLLVLDGRADPDGVPFSGGRIWVPPDMVSSITEEVEK